MITSTDASRYEMKEVVDRCRRMETRLTRFLETQGFDTQVKRAEWRAQDGVVVVPSPSVSLKEILMMVPYDWDSAVPIRVEHKGETMAVFYVPQHCAANSAA
jgi:hypothetical protein